MLLLIPLLPFLGFLVNAFFGRRLSKSVSGGVACAAMIGVLRRRRSPRSGPSSARTTRSSRPPSSGSRRASCRLPFEFRLDNLSSLMILVITGIGSLIHIYSTGYMHDEPDSEYARYFSYLNLFVAFMLVLVLGASFPVMFVGWEGVGLCSYLLIGFWFTKQSAADAGKKAFVVNRIGDFGFILGMLLLFVTFGTLDFQAVAAGGVRLRARDGRHRRHHRRDAAAVPRRHRQVGADPALRLAAGRDGRPDAGLGADPCRDDGHGRRLHDRPHARCCSRWRRRRWRWWRRSAPRRR